MYIGCYIKTWKAMSCETYLFLFHDIHMYKVQKMTSDFYYYYYTQSAVVYNAMVGKPYQQACVIF